MHKDTQERAQCHFTFVLSATCNSPALIAPGCFGMRRTRARSWTTYTKTARTTVRSWAVAWLPGPPRAAPRCRKRSAAESRPSSHRPLAKQPHIGTPYGHTKRPTSCAKGRYRAMAHRNHPHSARKRHLSAAAWRRALSWTSFKVILRGRGGTFFALIDVNCLISIFYYETHTSMSSVFYESVRICTAYCYRQS